VRVFREKKDLKESQYIYKMAGIHVSDAALRDMLDELRKDVAAFKLVEDHIKRNKMNKIVDRLCWHSSQEVKDVKKIVDKYNEEKDEEDIETIPLTDEEWETVVHPSGDWCLYMTFDQRAFRDKESKAYKCISTYVSDKKSKNLKQSHAQIEITIRRGERFTATTTLRDVLERIKGGLFYGFYEGIVPSADHHLLYSDDFNDIPIYKLQTGT
jgi:hypothetical protein